MAVDSGLRQDKGVRSRSGVDLTRQEVLRRDVNEAIESFEEKGDLYPSPAYGCDCWSQT